MTAVSQTTDARNGVKGGLKRRSIDTRRRCVTITNYQLYRGAR